MNIKVYLVVFIANKFVLISRKTEYVSVALTLVIPSFLGQNIYLIPLIYNSVWSGILKLNRQL